MRFVKTYIIFAPLSVLTGALLNVIWYLAGGSPVTTYSLIYYMTVGLIFGTVIIVSLSVIIMKVRKAVFAYLINAISEAVMLMLLFFYQNIDCPQWDNMNQWLIILLAVEVISTIMTAYWYHKILWYNHKLDVKKRDLDQ